MSCSNPAMHCNGLLPPASDTGYFQGNLASHGTSLHSSSGGGQGNSTMPYSNQCEGVAALLTQHTVALCYAYPR